MTMKKFVLYTLLTSFLFSGFFSDETRPSEEEVIESQRICQLFKKKAEDYKKKMRDDLLAKVTLASYEERANLFCNKAKELKAAREGEESGSPDENQSASGTDTNRTK